MIVYKSGSLNLLDHSGSVQACTQIALLFVPYKEMFCVKIATLSILVNIRLQTREFQGNLTS